MNIRVNFWAQAVRVEILLFFLKPVYSGYYSIAAFPADKVGSAFVVHGENTGLEKIAGRFKTKGVRFHFQKLNLDQPFASQLLRDAVKAKASLIVLFANQQRGWFDKMFLSSKSAGMTFGSSVPLLIVPQRA